MKFNTWLENTTFLDKVFFDDKIYFQMLANSISNFIKSCPVPVITWWYPLTKSISFIVKEKHREFAVDSNVSHDDYLTKVEVWLSQFYPQYRLTFQKEISLSEEEIIDAMTKENIPLEDALKLRKNITSEEHGIIERVIFKDDKFIISINGEGTLCIAGILAEKPMPVSEFLQQVRRNIMDGATDEQIRDFIFSNSTFLSKLEKKQKKIEYAYKMMINFFSINYPILKKYPLEKVSNLNYKWGNYDIFFESSLSEKDCLAVYKMMQSKEG